MNPNNVRNTFSPPGSATPLIIKNAFPRLAVAAVGALAFVSAHAADLPAASAAQAQPKANYARPFEPPTRPAFLPLPPGAVEPAGWLRDWCLAARDGFTGHMDEYDDEFKRAWAPDHKMTGEGLFWYKGAWPYEGGGYWFDGLARLGFALHDQQLIDQAKRRLYAVADRMNTNGLLFLWWLDRNNPDDRKAVNAALEGWPLWACGLLGRAMTGFYAGSGDPHILHALVKAYGSDPECLRSITGSVSNPWPAFDTYIWTGHQDVAEALDAMFKKDGGALLPILSRYRTAPDLTPGATVDNEHVVGFIESTTPWAVGYLWTGDRRYLRAAVGWHDLLERIAMQPYGVPVSDEWYVPTGAFRGSETCDVAGYIWSQVSLLFVTGEGRMADRAERAFFNAGPATVSRDYKTHVYFQSPNRFANGSPDFPHGPRAGGGSYQRKHTPLCCTAALNRIVPWYVTHMWMATYDNGLAATCYGPCNVTAFAADRVPVRLTCKTDYPFDETIEIAVEPTRDAAFPIDFRIPGWCAAPELNVNGATVAIEPDPRRFARVDRTWKLGDTVQLRFPMTPVVRTGRDAASGAPYDGAHRATRVTIPEEGSTRGVPYATVSYGPLLFALPIPDTDGPNTPDPSARWRYALNVQEPGLVVERAAMPVRWDWPLRSPLTLRANAVEIPWNPDPKAPRLPVLPALRSGSAESVRLVPYGCTKFRISMFPVAATPEVKPAEINRILFLGNSITLHGPKADIGWTGNWGMAASAEDKDYVHLVTRALARHTGATPQIQVRNLADFERNYASYDVDGQLQEVFAFDPDLAVLAIGENVPALDSEEAKGRFKAGVIDILRCAHARRHPLVVVRSCFWPDAVKDEILRQACEEAGGIFVDAGPIGRDPANAARSERSFPHEGVAAHPGDRGMQAIADAIVRAVLQR
ncbi:MAG: beta-L-arabinofuranosidase domain-containing protein [Verrucomicrobiia bacterium]